MAPCDTAAHGATDGSPPTPSGQPGGALDQGRNMFQSGNGGLAHQEQAIDEESFLLLDEGTINCLIPKIGLRLKFLKYYREFKENVPSTVPITSPDQPPIPIRPCPREDNATMLDPDTPIALHIIPFFDVRTILTNSYEGRLIVESLDKDSFVTIKQRRCMIRILVSYLIEKFGETPSSETKKGLASALVQAFPCLHDKTASGYDTWYAQCRNNRPATGFIEERLRNIRKRLRRLRRPQGEKDNAPSRTVAPVESAISEERAEEIKQWLRNNTQPISQVEQYMRETALCRAQWIRANNSKNMFEVLHEFPRLTTTGMIAQDFHVLHQDAAPKLFEKWLPWYTDRILHFAEREAKLPCSVEEMTEDAKGNFALKLLPVLLPPPPYKIGRKTVRPSIDESKKAFIDIQPIPDITNWPSPQEPFPTGHPVSTFGCLFSDFQGPLPPRPALPTFASDPPRDATAGLHPGPHLPLVAPH
ncbi:hypothetical protein ROHU_025785 [Labeo rohita]|uniref:Sterile alpha motif domain-containing 3-like n=1 Tax=Labeo rohita TaxID=84645 RepID=A0A498ME77_LABRO|nr:hypothetical protein ROHU_025785 [Labeo rohita]